MVPAIQPFSPFITSLLYRVERPETARGRSASRCFLLNHLACCWTSVQQKVTRCDNCSRTCCCFRIQARGYNVQVLHCKALNGNRHRTASRPAPAREPRPSWVQADNPPAPEICPASDVYICTCGSGTRFSPGWKWAGARGPGALSPGRTGSAAVWNASLVRTLETGRRGPGASCASEAWAGPDHRPLCPPQTLTEHWIRLIKTNTDRKSTEK